MRYRNDLAPQKLRKTNTLKNYFILFLLALSSCATKELVIMENVDNLLKATLTSNGKREVAYEKWQGIHVELTIKNISNLEINFPLERIEKSGLATVVINKKTNERFTNFPGLPLSKIEIPFVVLHPGEQVTIKDYILLFDIQFFKQKYVDLDLEVGTGFEMQINDKSIYAILNDTIPIVDIEKPPAKN